MIPRKWRLAMLNWMGAGYMTVQADDDLCNSIAIEDCQPRNIDVDGLSFNVMPAQGGVIIQLRKYDDKASRTNYTTHIIAEGQDVAETIGKIVALELWKA